MSVKKAESRSRTRRRRSLNLSHGKVKRCQNPKCGARNSPTAELCWRCGQPMTS